MVDANITLSGVQATGNPGGFSVTGPTVTNAAIWDPAEDIGLTLSNSNLTATNTLGSGVWYTVRSKPAFLSTNKVYAEFTASNVGVFDSAVYISVMNSIAALAMPGNDSNSFGYNQNGMYNYNGSGTTLASWTTGNTVCFAVDGNAGKIWVRVNGGNWNNDGTAAANPATNTGGVSCPALFAPGTLYFGTSIHTVNYSVTANLRGPFTYPVPSGFAAQPPVSGANPPGAYAVSSTGQLIADPQASLVVPAMQGLIGQANPTTSAIGSVASYSATGLLAPILQLNPLKGVVAKAIATLLSAATATSIYNYEGFDHEGGQTDLLQGIITGLVNANVRLSSSTPYNTGRSLDVQVVNGATAGAGYAIYNSGPQVISNATVGVMTRASIFSNVATDVGFTIGTTAQVFCRIAGGNILLYRGPSGTAVLLETLLNVVPASGWFYLEIQASIATANASVSIHINGIQVGNFTGLNTSADGTSLFNGILLGGLAPANSIADFLFDDIYLATGYLGTQARIVTLPPTHNGSQVQFLTIGPNANWQQVAELGFDADASYNYTNSSGVTDQFTIASLPSSVTNILATKVTLAARKDAATDIAIVPLMISGATTVTGTVTPLSNLYTYISSLYLADPNTGNGWSNAAVNALQVGYRAYLAD